MSSKIIAIFGIDGMLGRYVKTVLQSKHFVRSLCRKGCDISQASKSEIMSQIEGCDIVVNCAGIIKQRKDIGLLEMIQVNSVFPHMLADVCEKENIRMIHITTDCVFDGKKGMYAEQCSHDALDVYGKSKSLGEPETSTNIRTSIIGEKPEDKHSLIEWVKSQKGRTIQGYTNHLWNGITCLQLAKVIEQTISTENFWKGTRHIYSPNHTNKWQLLSWINDIYNLELTIKKCVIDPCDRRLFSKYDPDMQHVLKIPEILKQIQEQKDYVI